MQGETVEPSELTRQVESELLKELDAAGVFSRVTRFDPHPDVILSGRITALHEQYRPQLWAQIPDGIPYVGIIAQQLGMKTHVSSGEANLTLFVLKPTGEVLGTYTGKSTFNETFNPTNDVPPGTRLNRALSEAVHQIQDEMSRDVQLRKLASRQDSRHSMYPFHWRHVSLATANRGRVSGERYLPKDQLRGGLLRPRAVSLALFSATEGTNREAHGSLAGRANCRRGTSVKWEF